MPIVTVVGNVATECRHEFFNLSHTTEYTVVSRMISLLMLLELGLVILFIVSVDETFETDHDSFCWFPAADARVRCSSSLNFIWAQTR